MIRITKQQVIDIAYVDALIKELGSNYTGTIFMLYANPMYLDPEINPEESELGMRVIHLLSLANNRLFIIASEKVKVLELFCIPECHTIPPFKYEVYEAIEKVLKETKNLPVTLEINREEN